MLLIFGDLVTILETIRIESDRPRRRQACSCRTAFVMWLLQFLSEGQNRDQALLVFTLSPEIDFLYLFYSLVLVLNGRFNPLKFL